MTQRELTNKLNIASIRYYNGDISDVTDTEFDLLMKELQKMEEESGIIYPDSPTQRVGSDLQKGFKKVNHPQPMLTIENTYSHDELQEWCDKIHKEYDVEWFNVSVKYDGVSCELKYVGGEFVQASTRGDKNVGDDITLNVFGVKDIPFSLNWDFDKDEVFYVRGEILLPKSRLKGLNEERVKNKELPFANTRNACAGSIKQLDHKITASRGLIFRPWDCFGDVEFDSMQGKDIFLEKLGFKFEVKSSSIHYYDSVANMIDSFIYVVNDANLDYDYDGIVVKVNNMSIQNAIGTKDTRAIEWGIARKWNENYGAETILEDVVFQVGRTGVVTPVAVLKPVECNGVIISNATLNNEAYIKSLKLHYGDHVHVTRSGGVIPMIDSNITEKMMENHCGKIVKYPNVCPACGSQLMKSGEIWKCCNEDCVAQQKAAMIYWCSKDCMDVRTLGEGTINDLLMKNIGIHDIQSLYGFFYSYSDEDIVEILGEGYGLQKVQNIKKGLKESLSKPLEKIIYAIGIDGVGKVTARDLVKKFKTIGDIFNADKEELMTIDGIGEVVASAIYAFGHNIPFESEYDKWMKFLKEFQFKAVLEPNEKYYDEETDGPLELPLEGLSIVFSGKSNRFSGDDVEKYLESMGAKCGHSVSRKTNYLIIGDKPGQSKIDKANSLGIEIISENDFYQKFQL